MEVAELRPPVKEGKSYEFREAKVLNAPQQSVLSWIFDLGIQENYFDPEKPQHKVMFGWELINDEVEPGKPMLFTPEYNFTWSEKGNLTKDLGQALGRKWTPEEIEQSIDLNTLLGINSLITLYVYENEKKTYKEHRASSFTPLPAGMNPVSPINTTVPDWVKKKYNSGIKESNTGAPAGTFDQ